MRENQGKSALVVEGGGMRGVFSAGVLKAFGEAGFDPFDLYIGVSAGACNLASHLAGQYDRNLHIILKYSSTGRFISAWRFIAGGHFIDLDWLWEITIKECRLDLDRIFRHLEHNRKEYLITATSMESGEPLYLVPNNATLEHYIKISSALPFFYRGSLFTGFEYAIDGGIADPIPVFEAYRRGADRITVLRSRPPGYVKERDFTAPLYPFLFRKYPALLKKMEQRHTLYMESVDFIDNPPAGVEIFEAAPPEGLKVSRITKNRNLLLSGYEAGMSAGEKLIKEYNGS